jgi:hypothetical protein
VFTIFSDSRSPRWFPENSRQGITKWNGMPPDLVPEFIFIVWRRKGDMYKQGNWCFKIVSYDTEKGKKILIDRG